MTNNSPGFDEWIAHCFDRPVTDPEWFWDETAIGWKAPSLLTVDYLTHTFEKAAKVLLRFSDAQIAQGLNYIYNPSCSNIMMSLFEEEVPRATTVRCIGSIYSLFAGCFALRCSHHLSHLDEVGASCLNGICYMWWDVFPLSGQPEKPERNEIDSQCLSVMESTLTLPSDACRESALHGLGHWRMYYPERVEKIIRDFIWNNREIRNPLRNYAYAAQQGDVQ